MATRSASFGFRALVLTALSMLAFAANSILARAALRDSTIDAASFSTIRLLSGALMLLLLRASTSARGQTLGGSLGGGLLLFLYAVPFSFAYVSLEAGTGALLLFGAVQVTMLVVAWLAGERPGLHQWMGLGLAIAGLVYMLLPGVSAPPLGGAMLMTVAGIAWGGYSILGKGAVDALGDTAGNFVRAAPLALVVSVLNHGQGSISTYGFCLAALSGAVASGLGYSLWYAALRGLTSTFAATVQLSVPVLAALGGVVWMAEPLTPRLLVSTFLILGGVLLALRGSAGRPETD